MTDPAPDPALDPGLDPSETRAAAISGALQRADNDLVLSFLRVRRAIGLLGFFLPAALVAYAATLGGTLLPTMSDYHYTPMREIFVGTLSANAVFLWSYEGYRPRPGEVLSDRMAARTASLGALAVALAPTLPEAPAICTLSQCLLGDRAAALIHLAGATAFFGALAAFCLILFVRGTEDGREKRGSNRIYRVCGWTIVACLAAIAAIFVVPGAAARLAPLRPVFWLETVATFAFAVSWLVKGDALRPVVRAAG